eukprot:10547734-Alexandrium_andersonii.AAC.1
MDPASQARRPRRPPRSSAERRRQYARAEARMVERIIYTLSCLNHRGCQRTRLGHALYEVLLAGPAGDE